jgi:aspartate 1-decarboxylase
METQQRRMLRTLRNSESRGRGEILMDGAAARRAQVGDRVIIAAVAWMSEIEISSRKPAILLVDNANRCQR